jgi:hypothetical protein
MSFICSQVFTISPKAFWGNVVILLLIPNLLWLILHYLLLKYTNVPVLGFNEYDVSNQRALLAFGLNVVTATFPFITLAKLWPKVAILQKRYWRVMVKCFLAIMMLCCIALGLLLIIFTHYTIILGPSH